MSKPRYPGFKAIRIYVSSNCYLKVVVESEDVLPFSEECHTLYIQQYGIYRYIIYITIKEIKRSVVMMLISMEHHGV